MPRFYARKYPSYHRRNYRTNKSNYKINTLFKEYQKDKKSKERKIKDTLFNQSQGTTPTLTLLNGFAQGTTNATRIGHRMFNKNLTIKIVAQQHASATVATIVNVALIWVYQPKGTAPAASNIFDTNTYGYQDMIRNEDKFTRYFIIRKWSINLDVDDPEHISEPMFVKLNRRTVFNSGTAGNISDIEDGALYLFTYGDDNTNQATIRVASRLICEDD